MNTQIDIPHNEHLEMFRLAVQQDFPDGPPRFAEGDKGIGKEVRKWFDLVKGKTGSLVILPDVEKLNRAVLDKHVGDGKTDILPLCIMILAWGDMKLPNGRHLFGQEDEEWLAIADQLRQGKLSRSQGYAKFAALRKGRLPGMGPAYFTKLLHFLLPEGRKGYIMDQWLGCSVNLLLQRDLVRMDETRKWKSKKGRIDLEISSWVSDVNTDAVYEDFCLFIEALAEQMGAGWTPAKTEFALMSEGHGKGVWRRYVVEKRQQGGLSFPATL